jgi:hypothetical protein
MATYEEFTIDQGADVAIQLDLVDENDNPKDLTNHTVTAYLKKSYTSTDYTVFNAIVVDPPTDGICTLSLTSAQTDALKAGRYVYDVELSFVDESANTIVERILEGRIQISPSVTKVSGGGAE